MNSTMLCNLTCMCDTVYKPDIVLIVQGSDRSGLVSSARTVDPVYSCSSQALDKNRVNRSQPMVKIASDPNTPSMDKFRPGNIRTPTGDVYRVKLPQAMVKIADRPIFIFNPG